MEPVGSYADGLWVDVHRPRTTGDITGNYTNIQLLRAFLVKWEHTLTKHRAVLLVGPPGAGKTTAANLVPAELGFQVVEFNASNARTKAAMHDITLTTNHTIESSLTKQTHVPMAAPSRRCRTGDGRTVLVMEEVDGMGSGDIGGTAMLTGMIKKSRCPIICTCNSMSSKQMRSLAALCLVIKWQRPTTAQVTAILHRVAAAEGVPLTAAARRLACTGDVRHAVNALQMRVAGDKDITNPGIFELVGDLFKTPSGFRNSNGFGVSPAFIRAAERCYTAEPRDTPLFVHSNFEKVPVSTELTLEELVEATEAMSTGDLFDQAIHARQQWGLVPAHIVCAVVTPLTVRGSVRGAARAPRLDSPSDGKAASAAQKNQRSMLALASRTACQALPLAMPASLCMGATLRRLVVAMLAPASNGQSGPPDVGTAARLLAGYGLGCAGWAGLVSMFDSMSVPTNRTRVIPAKVKAALTRALNKTVHQSTDLVTKLTVGDAKNALPREPPAGTGKPVRQATKKGKASTVSRKRKPTGDLAASGHRQPANPKKPRVKQPKKIGSQAIPMKAAQSAFRGWFVAP